MLFADPPDAMGLKYQGFKDNLNELEYWYMLKRLLTRGAEISNVIWLSLNTKYTALIGHITHEFLLARSDWEFKPCVQTFSFGQHNHRDLGNNHRLLYRYMRAGTKLYPDTIRVPSWRQLNGDKRADPRGRVPGDVFDFPRVTGNSKQRRKFSPTQLHEELYARCIKLCCLPGSSVVDLFAGSGTLGRVADRCGVATLMLECSRETCDSILVDQPDVVEVKA
jgi:DNA modification methylase